MDSYLSDIDVRFLLMTSVYFPPHLILTAAQLQQLERQYAAGEITIDNFRDKQPANLGPPPPNVRKAIALLNCDSSLRTLLFSAAFRWTHAVRSCFYFRFPSSTADFWVKYLQRHNETSGVELLPLQMALHIMNKDQNDWEDAPLFGGTTSISEAKRIWNIMLVPKDRIKRLTSVE